MKKFIYLMIAVLCIAGCEKEQEPTPSPTVPQMTESSFDEPLPENLNDETAEAYKSLFGEDGSEFLSMYYTDEDFEKFFRILNPYPDINVYAAEGSGIWGFAIDLIIGFASDFAGSKFYDKFIESDFKDMEAYALASLFGYGNNIKFQQLIMATKEINEKLNKVLVKLDNLQAQIKEADQKAKLERIRSTINSRVTFYNQVHSINVNTLLELGLDLQVIDADGNYREDFDPKKLTENQINTFKKHLLEWANKPLAPMGPGTFVDFMSVIKAKMLTADATSNLHWIQCYDVASCLTSIWMDDAYQVRDIWRVGDFAMLAEFSVLWSLYQYSQDMDYDPEKAKSRKNHIANNLEEVHKFYEANQYKRVKNPRFTTILPGCNIEFCEPIKGKPTFRQIMQEQNEKVTILDVNIDIKKNVYPCINKSREIWFKQWKDHAAFSKELISMYEALPKIAGTKSCQCLVDVIKEHTGIDYAQGSTENVSVIMLTDTFLHTLANSYFNDRWPDGSKQKKAPDKVGVIGAYADVYYRNIKSKETTTKSDFTGQRLFDRYAHTFIMNTTPAQKTRLPFFSYGFNYVPDNKSTDLFGEPYMNNTYVQEKYFFCISSRDTRDWLDIVLDQYSKIVVPE